VRGFAELGIAVVSKRLSNPKNFKACQLTLWKQRMGELCLMRIDDDAADLFARVRALCGVRVGPDCLPPDIEAEVCEAFRALANHLELVAFRARQQKRGAA
jgi:hypothetical protein